MSSNQKKANPFKRLLPIILIILAVIIIMKLSSGTGESVAPIVSEMPATVSDSEKPYSSTEELYESLLSSYGYGGSSGQSYSYTNGSVSSGWHLSANTGSLNSAVSEEAREKLTQLLGNKKDTATVMVYMCGTDLESQSAMGSYDLQEMAAATLSDNVNIIVYTGGCKRWRTSGISSSVNQIYKVEQGSIVRLESSMGSKTMTDPATLTEFIKYCDSKYPASRNMLILWDHGGGSLSGYGYDENYSSSGSMTLTGINTALKNAGVTFDFIGFDACLMATVETALTVSEYADYMIASEESEPGVGWYYTNWLSSLCRNTSIPTIELGKQIVDDFISVCGSKCPGQATTLSVVDLAELSATVPEPLKAFSKSLCTALEGDGYSTVSKARSSAREFASSSKIDQMDITDFAALLDTDESRTLSRAVLEAVKYNGTGNITNCYGLSIYFPYRSMSYVSKAVKLYDYIGMDEDYSKAIQSFASVETGGQAASGGASSPIYSLFGDYDSFYSGSYSGSGSSGSSGSGSQGYSYSQGSYGSNSYGSGYSYGSGSGYGSSYYGSSYGGSSGSYSYDEMYDLLSQLMSGSYRGVAGLSDENADYLQKGLNPESAGSFISANSFDASQLVWQKQGDRYSISLSPEQWSLVTDLELNLFYRDEENGGYLDMGRDNSFSFTDDGALLGEFDGTWTAINGQPVAYYHDSTIDDGENYVITGHVPVLLNGQRADLILTFNNDNPYGFISGVRTVYAEGETETQAKISVFSADSIASKEKGDSIVFTGSELSDGQLRPLVKGDVIDFVYSFYSDDGEYIDSFIYGEAWVYSGEPEISYVYLPGYETRAAAAYRFTDIYQQTYWTTTIP